MENGKPYITTVRVRPARREKCAEHGVDGLFEAGRPLVEVTVCGETRAIVDTTDTTDGVVYLQDGFSEQRTITLVNAAYALMQSQAKAAA